jgi:hypothetical protein
MDITNDTDQDARVEVVGEGASSGADRKLLTWRKLAPKDHSVVKLEKQGPWRVWFRVQDREPLTEVVNSPKASVVLENAGGEYRLRSSVAAVDALILYVPSVRDWVEKLDVALRESGLSTWVDFRDLDPWVSAWDQLERVVAEARNIVVLVGAEDDATERQRIARAVALQALYEDPSKRMIPLLLGDAGLPAFVRTAAHWTRPIPSLRIADPARDWDRTVADLIEILNSEADPRTKGEVIDTAEEDRRLWRERMDYIGKVAAELRIQEDRARRERPSAKTA